MNKTVKTRWIEALRSGQYQQTEGVLRSERWTESTPSYCCLGVLCETFTTDWEYILSRIEEEGLIPPEYQKVAGLTRDDEILFSRMNDIEHKTFDQIADYIEENL